MAEKDITGRAVTRATEIIMNVRRAIEQQVPLGPNKVRIKPDELEKNYKQMTPEERAAFAASQGGIEDAMEMMDNGNLT